MARKIIDIGVVGNDGTGDSIRDSFRKVNDNFRELYSSLGLGERLTFFGLDDVKRDENFKWTDETIVGQNDPATGNTPLVTLNNFESGVTLKKLVEGEGIVLDFTTNPNEIAISAEFAQVVGDPTPQLGGDLVVRSGGVTHKIRGMFAQDGATPVLPTIEDEAVNKFYTDTKVSKAGTNAINPRTGLNDPSFGQMTGPLILARDPEPDDDEIYDGLIAATKRYVDNSAFGSVVNLYVATSGEDSRNGISPEIQGRALAYAYRSLEAALKRAEELVLEARIELGPYKKVLTYNNGADQCTLDVIDEAPSSGTGFAGSVLMSVDTITINQPGVNYNVGDILTIAGGTFIEPARYQVLSTATTPGAVVTFRQLSSGVYTALPGSTNVATTDDSDFGAGCTFNLTFKVNNVEVDNGGSGYGLVSVRISGGGGSGAFGTADVVSGVVQSITVTDQGTGFTSLPSVFVSLPRFLVATEGQRTDFTGDVVTSTPEAIRTRDIREGLFLRGETSGALAQILAHSGALDSSGREIFDVDIKSGSFIEGEVLSYGDVTKPIQITVLVESGIYEENLPLKVPQNVSIVGDEFRRCIIRPKSGVSSSPWAFQKFRRDLTIGEPNLDQLTIADRLFGYHYLTDSEDPVYPTINNKGSYRASAQLLFLNRSFIQKEVVGWIDYQIANNIAPFVAAFAYNRELCERDVGLILDSMIFDLKYGGSDRTISAALKYYQNASGLIAISSQLDETKAGIRRLATLAQLVIRNVEITETYQTVFPQIIDGAFIAESGVGGTSFSVSAVTLVDPVVITTSSPHGLTTGDNIIIDELGGTTELNGNDYYVTVINATSFSLYNDSGLTDPVDGTNLTAYTGGGYAVNDGGVISALTNAILDVIDESGPGYGSVNTPKNNDEMDVFLANDAVRWQAITVQGHGGFFAVLDPRGQILAKSPYAQECASFSKSTGRQVFHGGMFIDGFTGNIRFELLNKEIINATDMIRGRSYTIRTVGSTNYVALGAINNNVGTVFVYNTLVVPSGNGTVDDNSFLRVGGLDRFPQLPASFIVQDVVYRINYVRDFTFNVNGSTASLILDEATPWTQDVFAYDSAICYRDVGLIIDSLGYDIVLGTNFNQRRAGLTYRQANAAVVIDDQLDLTARAVDYAHDLAFSTLSLYANAQTVVESSRTTLDNIIRNGVTFAPALVFTNPPSLASNIVNAKTLLISNIDFIKAETVGYLQTTYPAVAFDITRLSTDVQYAIEALIYDLVYGGNSATRYAGLAYYNGVGDDETLQIPSGQLAETADGIDFAKDLAKLVIVNGASTVYSIETPVTGSASDSAAQTLIENLLAEVSDIITNGTSAAAAEVLPDLNAYAYTSALKTARTVLLAEKTDIQQATIDFVDTNANIYEILMPGNRSMLSNDFTQINDLGYGVIVTNGGLAEAVSMFTYYCHISYYAVNGGQIRSVGGSSAHGNYALIAEGADPLEVPTPVTLYYDLNQGAQVYFPSATYQNVTGGLIIYVDNYTYVPLNLAELEIDHGLGSIFRYPIATVETGSDIPVGVAKLSLQSAEGAGVDGLALQVPDGTRVTIRQGTQTVLTGDVVDVAVRPSTGMILRESSDVYRILQFEEYADPVGGRACTISNGSPAVITRSNHDLQPNYQISFETTGVLPSGLNTTDVYFVLANGFTSNSFSVSLTKAGSPIATTTAGSGTHAYIVEGLARTTLRENYNYVDATIWPTQPFVTSASTCTISIANPAVVTLVGHGFSSGDVIRFETTGALPTGIITTSHYFVKTVTSPDTFTITREAISASTAIETTGTQSGVHSVGEVIGRAGDSTFAVVPVGGDEEERILNTKFVWKGYEYTITGYADETVTLLPYALMTISPALNDSVTYFSALPTIKAAVPKDEPGTLTIRIALVRVTAHDLLDIGTGSYADTNYPNEIYGPPVNPYNAANEVVERGVGRCFYVTTDQFGNFSVGPYFRVDQGTGTVTFAAAIALSNLDGIGFKRGVPVSEFSVDSSFSDNATDTVPTENAVRTYIDRRLGLSHAGAPIIEPSLIPAFSGGFMSLDGQLAMKANMNLDDYKITNLGDATDPEDAINLRSLTFNNFQDISLSNVRSADILTFTGAANFAQNSAVVGDISFNIDSTANTVDAQINAGVILNADVNASAAIDQSKLAMTAASTRANATGIAQANLGLASFDSAQFDATSGWISVKNNGIVVGKIEQIATKTVLGNSTLVTGNVSAVPFTTVVNDGGAVKKSQYAGSTGFLRRIGFAATADTDYTVVDMVAGYSGVGDNSKLVVRDSNGDFGARFVSVERLLVDSKIILDTTTITGGGYTQVHGFSGQVALLLGDGTASGTKISFYDNDVHTFRTHPGTVQTLAPIRCSSVEAVALTTGGTSTAGTITGNWSLATGSRLQATYADLAEYYEGDKEYSVGTVVVFGGDREITSSNVKADHRVAGVVSDNAAYIMNADCAGIKTLIALQGRVPCKVVGKISKGDLLVTSAINGVAVSAGGDARAGTIIGKALENYDSDHIGTIEVAVGRA
jgi:hypothetical protein